MWPPDFVNTRSNIIEIKDRKKIVKASINNKTRIRFLLLYLPKVDRDTFKKKPPNMDLFNKTLSFRVIMQNCNVNGK